MKKLFKSFWLMFLLTITADIFGVFFVKHTDMFMFIAGSLYTYGYEYINRK